MRSSGDGISVHIPCCRMLRAVMAKVGKSLQRNICGSYCRIKRHAHLVDAALAAQGLSEHARPFGPTRCGAGRAVGGDLHRGVLVVPTDDLEHQVGDVDRQLVDDQQARFDVATERFFSQQPLVSVSPPAGAVACRRRLIASCAANQSFSPSGAHSLGATLGRTDRRDLP
jgi:hypothetical protein